MDEDEVDEDMNQVLDRNDLDEYIERNSIFRKKWTKEWARPSDPTPVQRTDRPRLFKCY